jgi:hypothetical protein
VSQGDWKLRDSRSCCFACDRPFPAEGRYYSALYFVPPEVERRDFCRDCWERIPRTETLAYWTLLAPDDEGDPHQVGPLDLNRLKRMIRIDLVKPTAPVGLAGLLVLMMARRRLARIESVGPESIRARFKDEDEAFEVPAPRLGGSTLERAQEALWTILDQVAGSAD